MLFEGKSWNFHGICWENDGVPSDLVSLWTKLPSTRHEKIRITFFWKFVCGICMEPLEPRNFWKIMLPAWRRRQSRLHLDCQHFPTRRNLNIVTLFKISGQGRSRLKTRESSSEVKRKENSMLRPFPKWRWGPIPLVLLRKFPLLVQLLQCPSPELRDPSQFGRGGSFQTRNGTAGVQGAQD